MLHSYMYLSDTTLCCFCDLCNFTILSNICWCGVTLVIPKDSCSWIMMSNLLFVRVWFLRFSHILQYLNSDCLSVVIFISVFHSDVHITRSDHLELWNPQRDRNRRYLITVYTHLPICKPDEISIVHKQCCFWSTDVPDVKQIHARGIISGLVTMHNRLCI